jgi:cyanoexosortase A
MVISQFARDKRFWLLALAACFTAMYFTLMGLADDTGHFCMSALFYFCVATLVWERRDHLTFVTDWPSVSIGCLLLGWTALNASPTTNEYTVRLFPLISGLGIALIASSWRHFKPYKPSLLLLFFLSVPSTLAYYLIDLAPLTAKSSSLLLWYAGFDVQSEGSVLGLVGGPPVEVVYDCSGIDLILYMLSLSIACLVMFPVKGSKKIIFPAVSLVIGFFLNSVRIAMLTMMLGSNQAAFQQWHTGTGSYTFALIGVLILGMVYWLLLTYQPKAHEENSWMIDHDADWDIGADWDGGAEQNREIDSDAEINSLDLQG